MKNIDIDNIVTTIFAFMVIVFIGVFFSFLSMEPFQTVDQACGVCIEEQQGKICGEWTCTKRGWK
jgi:hypothetical protein